MAERNKWIEEIKALSDNMDALKTALFFGTPYAPGRIDERYPDFMQRSKFAPTIASDFPF